MGQIAADGPNAQQIEYWNEVAGPRWVEMDEVIDPQIRPLGEAGIDRADPKPGERVLDVGCGCGNTTLVLAERVAPNGSVVGVDLSGPMLERAVTRPLEYRYTARRMSPWSSLAAPRRNC